ncbi:sensor histidine kinase [Streptomyces flavofungini]|uniref:sensor histidine kinase n=1 Tax=Streptomyces flavofungini TaxID=68200 RepID=UPI0025B24834|nr:sensor histidine kinase [Streptomyces flavofungini]WJV44231.1 sensor histidine kinase [Streptomyces flavofungini]
MTDRHRAERAPGAVVPPWSRADGLIVAGVMALDLAGYALSEEGEGSPATVAGLTAVAVSGLPLLFRRRHPLAAFVGTLALSAVISLVTVGPRGLSAALVVALFTVVRGAGTRMTVAAGAACLALPFVNRFTGPWPAPMDLVGTALATVLVIGSALAVHRWQRDVEANRRLLADRAVAEERRRIARELHDIVSHHITTMQLMAGGARANLTHAPEVARGALVTLEDSGRMALREMRQLLDVLRADDEPDDALPSPQPGAADLDRIVAESRLAGLPTGFRVHGEERPLPPTVGLTVFRIVQEALTNARKHAGGEARAEVLLTYGVDRVAVEVRDDGGGALVPAGHRAPSRPGRTGYGLVGMRERVALHGGSLTTGPQEDGGFAVTASLPLAPGDEEGLPR